MRSVFAVSLASASSKVCDAAWASLVTSPRIELTLNAATLVERVVVKGFPAARSVVNSSGEDSAVIWRQLSEFAPGLLRRGMEL
jgi:hypothetical protein